MAFTHRRRLKLAKDHLRRRIEIGERTRRLDDDGELVAAEPESHVGRHDARDPPCGGADQRIAREMAEGVVDDLQIVEVDDEQRP